jgi:pilus assembly protein CpaD
MYKYFSLSAASKTRLLLMLAVSSGLAACTADDLAGDDQFVPIAHYEKFPIEVAKGPVKMEVSSRQGSLQPSQINAISGFARSARNANASKIIVRRPSGGGASGKVAQETVHLLVQSGIPSNMIVRGTYPGGSKEPVQISYVRAVAVTKECGDWTSDLAYSPTNESHSNAGCAIQNNIAAMVVNPENFVVPAPITPATAASRMTAFETYSESGVGSTATTSTSTTGSAP